MIHEKIAIENENSQPYAALYTYLLDASTELRTQKRPMIVICPGGGYGFTSDREAELVAMQFLAKGYHAAVLRYSTEPARYPTAVLELGKTIKTIRGRAGEWKVDADKIIITGFSAGGHLAANYCTVWEEEWMAAELAAESEELRPNALILGYPVITSGPFAHEGSFRNLLGERYEDMKEELSLENKVTSSVPRTFIWHTYEDEAVPVQNALLFVDALVRNHIPVEFHLFEKGGHGLSLANKLTEGADGRGIERSAEGWIELVCNWLV